MTYRFGIVGPLPSVERILNLTQHLADDVEFVAMVYNHPREIPQILEQYRSTVKGWLFSGPIPLSVASPFLKEDELTAYCKPAGSGLYKALLQMNKDYPIQNQRYSIDIIRSEDLDMHESFAEAELPIDQVYLNIFEGSDEPETLIQFHMDKWTSGQSVAAVTCMHFVYAALQKQGVPVYRLTTSSQDIRQAAKLLIQQGRSSYFKDTQIGIHMIEADLLNHRSLTESTSYGLQYAELRIKTVLLPLCEHMDGVLVDKGNGRYQIFSTRGAIERELSRLHHSIEQIALEIEVEVSVGIGYGDTALAAENHALRALQQSKQQESSSRIIIVQDNGVIREAVGQIEEWSYSSRSLDRALLSQLNEANISVKTYKKIEALTQRMNWDGFTTAQLAQHLSMTVRNAQRIMSSLCQIKLAEVEGEELQALRGRPRKIYRLTQVHSSSEISLEQTKHSLD